MSLSDVLTRLTTSKALIIVIGQSGSGKSTFLKSVLNQLTKMEEEVAYLPQQPHLFKASIRDNVSLFKDCQDSSVSNVLNTVGLNFNINDIPNGLSRGQIQRLGLARVLLISAKILILDEPTASVDLVTRRHIIKIIEDLRPYHSILIATHDSDLICHADFLINLDE